MVLKQHLWFWVPFSSPHIGDPGEGKACSQGSGRKEEGIAPALQSRESGWMMRAITTCPWSHGHQEECPGKHGCPHFHLGIQTLAEALGIKLQAESVFRS